MHSTLVAKRIPNWCMFETIMSLLVIGVGTGGIRFRNAPVVCGQAYNCTRGGDRSGSFTCRGRCLRLTAFVVVYI